MKINLTNKQTNKNSADQSPSSRHGVTFSTFNLSTASLSRTLPWGGGNSVDEANKVCILTVRPAHCQTAATCTKNSATYTDKIFVPNVAWAW